MQLGQFNMKYYNLMGVPYLLIVVILSIFLAGESESASSRKLQRRFFFTGDGRIDLVSEKTAAAFSGQYRRGDDDYIGEALEAIDDTFDVPKDMEGLQISLRLIEFLDYLQDRLRPDARLTLVSGYRSPEYNMNVGKQGMLAAKASLHQYGMAADFKMQGISARRIWNMVKELGYGGTGYYQGETVHVDVGPARFWDQQSAGVDSGISDNNKLIGLVTDYDIYRTQESIVLRFIRMTAFPIGVDPEFAIYREGKTRAAAVFRPSLAVDDTPACPRFATIDQMANIRSWLPPELKPGRYRIRARFCNRQQPDMPQEIVTPAFDIRRP
jgi:uncharacterized protein YcbK (DUF882 family)